MRILLVGKTGQLGWELARSLTTLGRVIAPDRKQMDLSREESIRRTVRQVRPDLIVNAAAFTDVDEAERRPDLARMVNSVGPACLAVETARLEACLVHYSTDYVFDGEKESPYSEQDETAPCNTYGLSKLEGERAVLESQAAAVVLRTSWVYGARRKNFLNAMLALFQKERVLHVVDDQIGSPTWCRSIAEATAQLIVTLAARGGTLTEATSDSAQLYHFAARGRVSRYEQAKTILALANRLWPDADFRTECIEPISSSEFQQEARRPRSTVLSTKRLYEDLGIQAPDWKQDLKHCLEDHPGP